MFMYDSLSDFILDVVALDNLDCNPSLFTQFYLMQHHHTKSIRVATALYTVSTENCLLSSLITLGTYNSASLLHRDTADLSTIHFNLKCRNTDYVLSDTVDLLEGNYRIVNSRIIALDIVEDRLSSLTKKLLLVNYLREMNKPLKLKEVTDRLNTIDNYLQGKSK